MEFIRPDIQEYAERFSDAENSLLKELNRQTHLKVPMPRMLSGHLQGRFLSFISKLHKPQTILEIGTYTGYSALCLAEGLGNDGKLYTIDSNKETNFFAKKFIDESPYASNIVLMEGDALSTIPLIKERFDLVFIDADKINYVNYFNAVVDRVNSGGLIIADNVLWSGKVLLPEEQMDKETRAIHEFNKFVHNDTRVASLLLPIRDGLTILIKK